MRLQHEPRGVRGRQGMLRYIYHNELPKELIKVNGEADMTRQLLEAADG